MTTHHRRDLSQLLPAPQSHLASPQSRLAAFIIDGLLVGITFGIGWAIWLIVLAKNGTTPGHHLMGQKIVNADTGENLSTLKILIRELLLKGLLSWIIAGMTMMMSYFIDNAFIFAQKRQTLHDLAMRSSVVQVRPNFLNL